MIDELTLTVDSNTEFCFDATKNSGEDYFCFICLESKVFSSDQQLSNDNSADSVGFKLTKCGHIFCRVCFVRYLNSNISDGCVYLKCFSTVTTDVSDGLNRQTIPCNEDIAESDIATILEESGETKLLEKYLKFKFTKENKTARECPFCNSVEVAVNFETSPKIECSKCQGTFCYFHSNAHDFKKYPTCKEYEASIEKDLTASMEEISQISKPCPACSIPVMKSGGCNHMKCQCGAAFCWLCGKEIEDALFPAHFQWWNPSGCSNLQMNEALEPTPTARLCAQLLSLCQLILIGPLTLISTLASSLLCCSCILMKLSSDPKLGLINGNRNIFSICMSVWGVVWMALLFFFPLGAVVGAFFAAIAILILPCWVCRRYGENRCTMANLILAHRHRPMEVTLESRPNLVDFDLEAGENFIGRGRYPFSRNRSSLRDGRSLQDGSGLSGKEGSEPEGKGPTPPCESPLKLSDANVTLEWKSSWEEQDDIDKAGKIIADDCSVVVGEAPSQHTPAMLGWKEHDDGKEESGAE